MKFIYKIWSSILILVFIAAGNGYSLPQSKTTLRVQLQSSTEDGAKRQIELVRRVGSMRGGRHLGLGKSWPGSTPMNRLSLPGYVFNGLQEIANVGTVIITSDGLAFRPEVMSEAAFKKLEGIIESISPALKRFLQQTGVNFIMITKGENAIHAIRDTLRPLSLRIVVGTLSARSIAGTAL